jgi:hypothetical protein
MKNTLSDDQQNTIFLATDDAQTQNKIQNIFKNKIIYVNKITSKYNQATPSGHAFSLRNTTIEDALTDIWICSQCKDFYGTPYSSFSDFISILRRIHGLSSQHSILII